MRTVNKKDSLYFLLVKLLTASMVAAVLFFCFLSIIGEYVVDNYYISSNYMESRNESYIQKLQDYVTKYQVSSKDSEKISEWVKKQKMVSIQIYRDNVLMYDSNYGDKEEIWEENVEQEYYDWESYYQIRFADGNAEAVIYGTYAYQLYSYAMIAELLLAFILFLVLVISGIRKKMTYILQLSDEIELLEGGNLDYPITVQGKDELAELAKGLDCMRQSFRDQVEQESKLVQENQKIVTEMSHDLRTPLTSIMLYTEILKKGTYKNEKQLLEYIEKIDRKARRMKQLSDHLFEYSLVTGDTEIVLEKPELYEVLFYDLFSETCSYLEQKGFQVKFQVKWTSRNIQVYTNYIARIMDNITSNIIKYADEREPVIIGSLCDEKAVGFFIENAIRLSDKKTESTSIGIQSIKNMIMKMGGKCKIIQTEDIFRIEIIFPCVN